jgi:hypothetical protein
MQTSWKLVVCSAVLIVAACRPPDDGDGDGGLLLPQEETRSEAVVATSAYQEAVFGDDPVAYYPLNETSGTVANDLSGNALNGVYGTSVAHNGPQLLTTDTGTSAVFNGSSSGAAVDYIQVAQTTKLEPTTGVTLEAWVEVSTLPSSLTNIVAYGPDNFSHNPYVIRLVGSQLTGEVNLGGGGYDIDANTMLTTGKPYYVVLSYNGSTLSLYINGVLDYSYAVTGTLGGYGTSGLGIGHEYTAGSSAGPVIKGDVSNVAVYAKGLSAQQVASHYAAASAALNTRCPSNSHTCTPGQSFQTDPLNCGKCAHSCLGGTCVAGLCQPVALATDTGFAQMSQDTGNIYWTSYQTSGTTGGVYKVAKASGSTKYQVVAGKYANAISVVSGDVYYTLTNGTAVRSVPVAGGSSSVLFTPPVLPYQMVTTSTINVYYYDGSFIQKYAVGPKQLSQLGSSTRFGDVFSQLALDDSNVYAASWRQPLGYVIIDSKSGGGKEVDLQKNNTGGVTAVAADDTHIFWSNDGSGLTYVIPTADALAGETDWTTFMNHAASALVTESGSVYAAVDATGIFRESSAGGTVTQIYSGGFASPPEDVQGQAPNVSLVADSCAVYFVDTSAHIDMLAR